MRRQAQSCDVPALELATRGPTSFARLPASVHVGGIRHPGRAVVGRVAGPYPNDGSSHRQTEPDVRVLRFPNLSEGVDLEKTGGTFLFPRDGPPKLPCRRRRVCRSPHQPSLKRADGQQRDKQQDAESGDDRQLLQLTGQRPTLLDHVERSYSTQSLCQPLERARDTSDTKAACRGEGGIECAAHVHPPGGSLLLFRRERARLPGALAPAVVADLWRHDLRGEHRARHLHDGTGDWQRRRRPAAALQPSLAAAGLHDADSLLGQYFAGPEDLRRFLGEGPILTDDRPMLEYYLSLPRDERPLDPSGLQRSPSR